MPYDKYLGERIDRIFLEQRKTVEIKKMMGGLCYMLDQKMCCAIHFSKKHDTDLLMVRIGPEFMEEALKKEGCKPMDMRGKPMKDYVFVSPSAYDLDEQLEYWIKLGIAFNPKAKRSKPKKK